MTLIGRRSCHVTIETRWFRQHSVIRVTGHATADLGSRNGRWSTGGRFAAFTSERRRSRSDRTQGCVLRGARPRRSANAPRQTVLHGHFAVRIALAADRVLPSVGSTDAQTRHAAHHLDSRVATDSDLIVGFCKSPASLVGRGAKPAAAAPTS